MLEIREVYTNLGAIREAARRTNLSVFDAFGSKCEIGVWTGRGWWKIKGFYRLATIHMRVDDYAVILDHPSKELVVNFCQELQELSKKPVTILHHN